MRQKDKKLKELTCQIEDERKQTEQFKDQVRSILVQHLSFCFLTTLTTDWHHPCRLKRQICEQGSLSCRWKKSMRNLSVPQLPVVNFRKSWTRPPRLMTPWSKKCLHSGANSGCSEVTPFSNVCQTRIPFAFYSNIHSNIGLSVVYLEMRGFLTLSMFLRRGNDSSFSGSLRRSGGGSFRRARRSMMETSEVLEDGGPSATSIHQPEESQNEPINSTKNDN